MSELLETLLPAVEQQLCSPDTAFVKAAYDRLLASEDESIDEQEARRMIALCLADETERMLEDDRDFDLKRYETLLSLLPAMPE